MEQLDCQAQVTLASDLPLLSGFKKIKQTDYKAANPSKVLIADFVRIAAAVWTGLNVLAQSAFAERPDFIYERVAVLQSMSSFHRWKYRAVRVVETNGIMARETARDRQVLRNERLASVIERHVLRRADIVVAVSAPLAREIGGYAQIDSNKIIVVPNGVESSLCERQLRRNDQIVRIGFCGSLVKWQNVDQLIIATANLANSKTVGQVQLAIVGDGPAREELEQLVEKLRANEIVKFFGKMPRDEAIDEMSSWHIGLAGHTRSTSASMYHSPLKLYEYAALGMDIVCTDSDDAQSLAKSGVSVSTYTDTEELARELEFVARNCHHSDSDLHEVRRRMLLDHGWSARGQKVLNAVESVRKQHRP